jgi:type IV pilus biogenesis protein PilP
MHTKHKLILSAVTIVIANFSAHAGLPLLGSSPSADPLTPTAAEVAQNAKKPVRPVAAPTAPAPVATVPTADVSSSKVDKYDDKPETVISSTKAKALVAPAAPAPAVTTPPSAAPVVPYSTRTVNSSATYRQLDELRTQNAILQEQVKSYELRNKINGTAGGAAPSASNMHATASVAPSVATVQLVDGIDGMLTATVLLPTGGTVNVRVGSSIPGAGVVKTITLNEVCVSGKGESQCLPFAKGLR